MKTRTTILALAALTVTSLSTLAPSSASASGMGDGYGGRQMGGWPQHPTNTGPIYRPTNTGPIYRPTNTGPIYRPTGGWPQYGGVYRPWYPRTWNVERPFWRPHIRPSYVPAEEPCDCEAPVQQTYVPPQPIAEPCSCEAPAPIVKRIYVPVRGGSPGPGSSGSAGAGASESTRLCAGPAGG